MSIKYSWYTCEDGRPPCTSQKPLILWRGQNPAKQPVGKRSGGTAKPSVDNRGGLLKNTACEVKYHIIKPESPNLQVNSDAYVQSAILRVCVASKRIILRTW